MNKKILIPIISVIILFFVFLLISILRYRSERPSFLETIPLFSQPTPKVTRTIVPTITTIPGVPNQTNLESIAKAKDSTKSLVEKNKIFDALPIREEDFSTSANIKTTINIYNLLYDPESALRVEIYGINYNNQDINSKDALAFKESFLKAKQFFSKYQVNLNSLQIIYGNRQYIQDTATYWVKTFKLLD
ncbi:hypothetical protein A3K29_01015 [Candidatus Collierbacteria bacterium RIFOXYB2_FULL_46_14]|uniref:Uncharacterized protein n=1 Tax=Candidatus Collierbacteria bacterium GW2011_GWA2_46_26 TaxID=1618381 RepID=A0A0G1PKT3_9BACT|nr:MAG: hypothetical protein UW29_C0003G0034 [Candidatus Collierbacteria bacterium GW2011_GWC2_44_13]KKU33292.1 MAG: hypothetical protein UX47_C0005G0094 [Candidatus Collierbacteria bacterium GW2011_GWA2_46_26]OGD72712.1 MAG: hypothetical protein A3K29_01015 [Candidatus Collierbacteria bacterium RIFOXYB2_FULL_46_14]OGD75754.1 MAG: hypothetical protein A3K43_01015 [Candidatus Collierbacteria bacterium RIFOXYA2_FULL_46_20]OGD77090.1 MAG: hypothetical protein A3K39_01015 [Candidatus Collierbacteri